MKIEEIRKDLERKLESTVEDIAVDSLSIMQEELQGFYAGGTPSVYRRTYTLSKSPEVKDIYRIGKEAGLIAGLDKRIGYTTGGFSGEQVIDAAENSYAGIVGKGGFWKRSEERIKKAVDEAVKSNFK